MTPISWWILFHVALVLLLAIEWLTRKSFGSAHRRAIFATLLWTLAALVLAGWIRHELHTEAAIQYLAGYAMEESLSVDNLFVFLLLFRTFGIPESRQSKVLFWGVAGAIVLRGAFIAGGLGLLNRFAWIDLAFGGLLILAAIRLLKPEEKTASQQPPGWLRWLTRVHPVSPSLDHFVARENGVLMPSILLLALVAIELTDMVFALDSIPAVLSITRHPFLAYTSNIMAVMGLRSLYILLARSLSRLRFLHFGLAAILGFAGIKMVIERWVAVGPIPSLAVILSVLAITVAASLLAAKRSTSPTSTSHLSP